MARAVARSGRTETYKHPEADLALRPEVGTQPQFRKKKPPAVYRYDSSLAPALDWDGENSARELGEWLLASIDEASRLAAPHEFGGPRELRGADGRVLASCRGLHDAVAQLKRLGRPFLDWAGKAERLSFEVPTLPLFVHERLSTMAIVETLKGHTKAARGPQLGMFEMFGDPRHPIADQVLKAYEYRDEWVNRMILGDSLVVMSSLLHYEGLGGQVQMIYIDPPYGVKFGSNFQPFVRKRDVTHNDDADMTREPEMVKAYRDTWELGLHSYLTYLRDRLLLARDLLHPSGSVFVQISDENLHHVRELIEGILGSENFVVTIPFKKKGGQKGNLIDPVNDYLIWACKDIDRAKTIYNKFYVKNEITADTVETFGYLQLGDGRDRTLKELTDEDGGEVDYREDPGAIFLRHAEARLFASTELTSGGQRKNQSHPYVYQGRTFDPGLKQGKCWKHTAVPIGGSPSGMDRLAAAGRLFVARDQLRFRRYLSDFGYEELSNWWDGVGGAKDREYVVQTNAEIVKRCILMTTKPGDLVLDPTCGSGTTAYVAEEWGRRWITIDTSRVPLALARQRLLTATFPYYQLKDEARGPASGFMYLRKQNRRGEEIGGIAPHITSSTIANDEPPEETVIVDRPEKEGGVTRVSGPFCVEATIPMPVDWDGEGGSEDGGGAEDYGSYLDRMIEVLRRAPVLQLGGGQSVTLRNVRPPAKSLSLSAEAMVEGDPAMSPRDAVAAGSPPPQPSPIEGSPMHTSFTKGAAF